MQALLELTARELIDQELAPSCIRLKKSFSDFVIQRSANRITIAGFEGKGYGINVWNDINSSCARFFLEEGSIWDYHKHEEAESLVIITGSLDVTLQIDEDGSQLTHRLLAGGSIGIPPETLHKAVCLKDTTLYAICVPSNKDWPNSVS